MEFILHHIVKYTSHPLVSIFHQHVLHVKWKRVMGELEFFLKLGCCHQMDDYLFMKNGHVYPPCIDDAYDYQADIHTSLLTFHKWMEKQSEVQHLNLPCLKLDNEELSTFFIFSFDIRQLELEEFRYTISPPFGLHPSECLFLPSRRDLLWYRYTIFNKF